MARVKKVRQEDAPENLCEFPNFHKSGSIKGMKELYYGKNALLVRCGDYIYNVTSQPDIYYNAGKSKTTYCIISTSDTPHLDILNTYCPNAKKGSFAEVTNNSGLKKYYQFQDNIWQTLKP